MENINRDRLDKLICKAADNGVMSQEEVGFAELLVNRFRGDLDKKIIQKQILEGEIAQLKNNEIIITEIIKNLVAAADREKTRLANEKELRKSN